MYNKIKTEKGLGHQSFFIQQNTFNLSKIGLRFTEKKNRLFIHPIIPIIIILFHIILL